MDYIVVVEKIVSFEPPQFANFLEFIAEWLLWRVAHWGQSQPHDLFIPSRYGQDVVWCKLCPAHYRIDGILLRLNHISMKCILHVRRLVRLTKQAVRVRLVLCEKWNRRRISVDLVEKFEISQRLVISAGNARLIVADERL